MNIRRQAAAVAIALGLTAMGGNVFGARLPDWARTIADAAPPLGEEIPKDMTRVLFTETHVSVDKYGTFTTRWRYASQALNARGDRLAMQGYPFREDARVVSSKVWHLPLGEKAQKGGMSPVDVMVDDSFLSSMKTRYVAIGGITRGSIVFFEFVVAEEPLALMTAHLFYQGVAVSDDRFEIELPSKEWTIRTDWLRREGPPPTVVDRLWTWEMKDIPAPEAEPLSPPPADEAPLLIVALSPPPGVVLAPLNLPDWKAVGVWFDDLAKGRDAVTAEIHAAVKQVSMPPGVGFFQKLKALAMDVRGNIRYLDRDIAPHQFQPDLAGAVLTRKYGDCKDKGTLLRAYLTDAGYTSYPVLINAGSHAKVSEKVAAPSSFNHFIVAVALPANAKIPPEYSTAAIEVPAFGRILIVDVTDPYTAIGYIPLALEDQSALLVAGPRSRLITIPKSTASVHRVVRSFHTQIHDDKSLTVEGITRSYGDPASAARASYAGSSQKYRKASEESFLETFVRAESKSYSVQPEAEDGAFVETMTWYVPPPSIGAPHEAPLFVGSERYVPRASLSKRKTAVLYAYPITIHCETLVTGAPAAAPLPRPDDRRGAGWSVTMQCAREGEVVKGVWEMILTSPRFEVAAMPELRKFWQAVNNTGAAAIPFTTTGAAAGAAQGSN